MSKTHISITLALILTAGAVACVPNEVFAQEGGGSTPPPTVDSTPPPPDLGGTQPPPPPSGGGSADFPPERGMIPPPPSGGNFEPPRMMPPPPQGGGEFRPPEMMGRPTEQGGSDYRQEYKKEYDRQFNDEVRRQTEMRTQEMQKRFTPPQGGGEFRPKGQPFDSAQGQPFMEGGRDSAQGKPFMGERMPEGRPFGGGGEGDHGPYSGGPENGFGGPEMRDERGFGGFGGMGGGGENMGPSEEEVEEMMKEQESRMKEEQLRQMKRGMQGLEQGLKQIQRMAERLAKKGITVPADAQALISELVAARDKIKSATEFTEEVEVAMELIQDKGQDLGEVGQKLGMLEQMSQMTKQVEKQFVTLDKALAKAKKRKEASQFPAVVSKVEGQISTLKQKWAEVKANVASGDADPDDLRNVMDGIFEEVGDAHRSIEMIRQLGSVAKMLKSAGKEITTFEKTIARQRKAGKDVLRLDELLLEGKAKLSEVRALTEQSGFEPEELFDLMQELEAIGNEAHDELDRITGTAEANKLGASVLESLQNRRLGF